MRFSGTTVVAVVVGTVVVSSTISATAASLITGAQIRDRSITAVDVAKNSLTSTEIKNGTLTAADFAPNTLLKGDTGLTGPEGPAGQQGVPGAPGVNGANCVQGAAGPKGETGMPGANGADGAQGPSGPPGPKGDLGPQGVPGPAGAGLNSLNSLQGRPCNVGAPDAGTATVVKTGRGGPQTYIGIQCVASSQQLANLRIYVTNVAPLPVLDPYGYLDVSVPVSLPEFGTFWLSTRGSVTLAPTQTLGTVIAACTSSGSSSGGGGASLAADVCAQFVPGVAPSIAGTSALVGDGMANPVIGDYTSNLTASGICSGVGTAITCSPLVAGNNDLVLTLNVPPA